MPKKLAELLKKGDALQSKYDESMTKLKSCAKNGYTHEMMISEGEEELLHCIAELVKKGTAGKLVSDFLGDKLAKSFAVGIEIQKAAYLKQCKTYWELRDHLDTLMAECTTLVADATATIAEKKKLLFASASVTDMQSYRDDLETWLKGVSVALKKLRGETLPKEKRLSYATPGATMKMKLDELSTKQNLHDMAELLQFVDMRAKVDTHRANTLKAVRDRLAAVVKASPDA